MSTVLAVNDVWKAYPDVTGTPRTLRAAVARRTPLLRRGGAQRWALRGIELELGAGEAVGLVGHNGSGKSTLLRLVAGLGRPTRGSIAADPDTSAVLSLGASFDELLTGRENAVTAAIVAGMSRGEARRALDAMLDFSELGEFVDAPVRTYSEGMKLRLAFGLLATVDPRLLVLDEVLAVGDTAFRARCLERIRAMRAGGTALMLASHAVSELEAVAERAVWLHRGAIRMVGPLHDVVAGYERAMHEAMLAATPVGAGTRDGRGESALVMGESRFGSQAASIAQVTVGDVPLPAGATAELTAGAPLRLGLAVTASDRALDSVIVSVCIRDEHGVAAIDLHDAEPGLAVTPGGAPLQCTLELERVDLRDGEYTVDVGVYGADWDEVHDFHHGAYRLRVRGTDSKAMLVPPHSWRRRL